MSLLRLLDPSDLTRRRAAAIDDATLSAARGHVEAIRSGGETHALTLAERFGDVPPHTRAAELVIRPERLRAALGALPAATRHGLEASADSIRAFALAQRACINDLDTQTPGDGFQTGPTHAGPTQAGQAVRAGHRVIPLSSAGCYAPGGRYPLPSSVLMTAITARAAGVASVWVASPKPTVETLAAAAIAGADGVLPLGGIPAIVSMSEGLFGLPACDIVTGPGNRWVTAAKSLIRDRTTIDLVAGPSELLIIADRHADAALIAADLLAQAEHDEDALPVLIVTDVRLIDAVERELEQQLATLPTRATAAIALRNGGVLLAAGVDEAVAFAEAFAPEHLELMIEHAAAVEPAIRNAGAVFIGRATAEVFGDYGLGPNHTLPTGGWAALTGGLSVFSFLKVRTFMETPEPGPELIDRVSAFARIEGLEAHARAAERRRY